MVCEKCGLVNIIWKTSYFHRCKHHFLAFFFHNSAYMFSFCFRQMLLHCLLKSSQGPFLFCLDLFIRSVLSSLGPFYADWGSVSNRKALFPNVWSRLKWVCTINHLISPDHLSTKREPIHLMNFCLIDRIISLKPCSSPEEWPDLQD